MPLSSVVESGETAAIFTIRAQGRLARNWRSSTLHRHTTFSCGTRAFPVAVVSGRLTTQAELFCVLDDLYEQGLPLLSLTVVDSTTSGSIAPPEH